MLPHGDRAGAVDHLVAVEQLDDGGRAAGDRSSHLADALHHLAGAQLDLREVELGLDDRLLPGGERGRAGAGPYPLPDVAQERVELTRRVVGAPHGQLDREGLAAPAHGGQLQALAEHHGLSASVQPGQAGLVRGAHAVAHDEQREWALQRLFP